MPFEAVTKKLTSSASGSMLRDGIVCLSCTASKTQQLLKGGVISFNVMCSQMTSITVDGLKVKLMNRAHRYLPGNNGVLSPLMHRSYTMCCTTGRTVQPKQNYIGEETCFQTLYPMLCV
jgi:hypothetical protein